MMKKISIYIDSNFLYTNKSLTGIQRVIHEIQNRAVKISKEMGIECEVIMFKEERYWTTKNVESLTLNPWLLNAIYQFGEKVYEFFQKKKQQNSRHNLFENSSNKFQVQNNKIEVKSIESNKRFLKISDWVCSFLDWSEKILLSLPFYFDVTCQKVQKLAVQTNDIILVLDPFISNERIDALIKLHASGCKIVPMVHDLIPFSHPHFLSDESNHQFRRFYSQILPISSGILSVSHYTKTLHEEFFKKNTLKKESLLPIFVTHLGSNINEIKKSKNQKENVRDEIKQQSIKENFFLMVGSIDTRKGYDIALEAFDNLWNSGRCDQLFIIGKEGGSEADQAFILKLRSHPKFSKNLFMVNDASDDELNYLYDRAKALIFASQIEGFGLPLVEAMNKKLPVIASNIEVFEEIGGNWPIYFERDNSVDLQRQILQFEDVDFSKKKAKVWLNWDQATQNVIEKLILISHLENEK